MEVNDSILFLSSLELMTKMHTWHARDDLSASVLNLALALIYCHRGDQWIQSLGVWIVVCCYSVLINGRLLRTRYFPFNADLPILNALPPLACLMIQKQKD